MAQPLRQPAPRVALVSELLAARVGQGEQALDVGATLVELKPAATIAARTGAAAMAREVFGPPVLKTERLLLRPLMLLDRDPFVALLSSNREHLAATMNVHAPGERDERCFERLLGATTHDEERGYGVRRAICRVDGSPAGSTPPAVPPWGLPVGMVHALGVRTEPDGTRTADVGWWIGSAHSGQRLASEALDAFVRFALSPGGLDLHELRAAILPTNPSSARVATRAGFRALVGEDCIARIQGVWTRHQQWLVRRSDLAALATRAR